MKSGGNCHLMAILLYSSIQPPYACIPMLLVIAAMEEELKTGMSLCRRPRKIPHQGISLWQASRNDKLMSFLKTGVGTRRSAASLEEALSVISPSHILVIGYAGALDPDLKLGDLVAVQRALAFNLGQDNPAWENIQLEGAFQLTHYEELAQTAVSIGLNARMGDAMTSPYVLGDPAHKNLLYEKFHALIVDMETASLARVAASKHVPLSCIRVISDEAGDTFLAPFSHDPSKKITARAGKLISKGMVQTFREWKKHTLIAKKSLAEFLSHYL